MSARRGDWASPDALCAECRENLNEYSWVTTTSGLAVHRKCLSAFETSTRAIFGEQCKVMTPEQKPAYDWGTLNGP